MTTSQHDAQRVPRWTIAVGLVAAVATWMLGSFLAFNVVPATMGTLQRRSGNALAFSPPARPLDANGDGVFVPMAAALPTSDHAGLPAALTAEAAPGPVVTPSVAQPIVSAVWKLRADALSSRATGKLAVFETGLALEADVARQSCGCSSPGAPGSMDQVALFVPRQATYPATIMAEVATTQDGKPFHAWLVLQRDSSSGPWLLAFVGGMLVDSVDMRYPAMDADGFLAPQTATPLIDPATAHSQLASYWRDAKRTGAVPPSDVFEPGVWTTDYAQTLTQYGQGQVARNGLVGHYAYQADPAHDPLFTFPEGQGWQLACSALRVQTTFSGADASDGPVQDHARDNWGPEIAPGVYRSIVYTDVATPCIDIPPAGSGQLVRVHGAARHTSVSVGLP